MACSIRNVLRPVLAATAAAGLLAGCASPSQSDPQPRVAPPLPPSAAPTYVDLVELAKTASIVARVQILDQIVVPSERAPGVAPGKVRLYLEAATQALLSGSSGIGDSLAFLADRERDADGDPPDLEELSYLVFADLVEGRPGELRLAGPGAMLPAGAGLEQQVRTVLTQLAAADQPPMIEGVREVISVPGNLAGESETQIFLHTRSGDPVSLNVIRRPGMAPAWGASWTEIVDQAARPPEPGTLEWYSLACFLPQALPADAFLQGDDASRRQARADYQLILDEIGACARNY